MSIPRSGMSRSNPKSAPADPLREAADELLLQDAFNLQKPLFGICYGMQSMNVWRGGSLIQHLETSVNHTPGRHIAEAHSDRGHARQPARAARRKRSAGKLSCSGEFEPSSGGCTGWGPVAARGNQRCGWHHRSGRGRRAFCRGGAVASGADLRFKPSLPGAVSGLRRGGGRLEAPA